MSDSEPLPLQHRSEVRVIGPLPASDASPLEGETPLFAADLDFALEQGGPLTRAFLEATPLNREAGVVVDSSLVWLTPGLAHAMTPTGPLTGPRGKVGFVHEPFPGIAMGVRGAANRNLTAVHRLCVWGLDCTPELAEGQLSFATPEQAEAFWLPTESLDARDQQFAHHIESGELCCTGLPLATIVEFGWGTLLRPRPATEPGFQFMIRVSIGDPRPHVNGLRNHAQL
ncbi:hypothetical protein [Aeoliella mucimassa]|uniref:Uncharacterized protein n=1 Tax=Aeoliella mucimassa TaxID=2527972 RepID=A0A518AWN7_9BACT|nr:hypothetical protein [Aeoliella mucimassa]QDU59144.1 hypothetical protein Pan181_53850 [Aeoliella mucimassa]